MCEGVNTSTLHEAGDVLITCVGDNIVLFADFAILALTLTALIVISMAKEMLKRLFWFVNYLFIGYKLPGP